MDLWIRSQDRTKLIKSEGVFLFIDGEYHICSGIDGSIAKYKTKERALQVLDAIQNILQPVLYWHEPEFKSDEFDLQSITDAISIQCSQKAEFELKQAGQVVYEMPKE